jgi:hypothetical protein
MAENRSIMTSNDGKAPLQKNPMFAWQESKPGLVFIVLFDLLVWLAVNLAVRFFLGACVVYVVAMMLTEIRHHYFSWDDLRSGLVLVALTLLLSMLLGSRHVRR